VKRRLSLAARRRCARSRLWRKLTDPAPEEIWRGAVFRFPARWPYEETVDYLLTDQGGGFVLVVATGYKAGIVRLVLPEDAYAARNGARAISRSWMIANWERWIYEDCGARDVLVADGYPAPR
jgi:Immunity protein 45